MTLASSIRYYRELNNMYQSDLGKALGISAQAVSKWELGKAEPDSACINKMCELFGITADQLLGRSVASQEDDFFKSSTENIRIIARGMSKLSDEEQWRLLQLAKVAFPNAFPEDHLE